MRRGTSETGGARVIVALVVLAVVALAVLVAGKTWLSKYEDPVEIAGRLEKLVGSPVTLAGVETRPLRRQVLLRGFEMAPSTSVESATLDIDPSALIAGEWEFGDVDLYRPTWRVPERGGDTGKFLDGLSLPILLATRAETVTLRGGTLLAPAGAGSVATGITGALSRQSLDSPYAPVNAELVWEARGGKKMSVEAVYLFSESSDSVSIEKLRLTIEDLLLSGRAYGSAESPVWARAELASEDFLGGAMKLDAGFREGPRGGRFDAHVVLTGADCAELLFDRFGVSLFTSGLLDADFKIEGSGPFSGGVADVSARGEGDVRIVNAAIDPNGLLRADTCSPAQGGAGEIESLSGHLDISHEEILIQNMTAISSGMTWTGSGVVGRDGALAGALLGRIPAQAIAAEGTAVGMFAAMLAGRDGRIPAAFSVGGTLEKPSVGFDVDGTADAIAESGKPQAKRLIKGLSRQDKENIARAVDDFLRDSSGK